MRGLTCNGHLPKGAPACSGLRDCTNQAALYWELPDGHREYRCRLHEYQLVPQEAVRHDYHLVPGDEAAGHGQAHEYRIVAEPDA